MFVAICLSEQYIFVLYDRDGQHDYGVLFDNCCDAV